VLVIHHILIYVVPKLPRMVLQLVPVPVLAPIHKSTDEVGVQLHSEMRDLRKFNRNFNVVSFIRYLFASVHDVIISNSLRFCCYYLVKSTFWFDTRNDVQTIRVWKRRIERVIRVSSTRTKRIRQMGHLFFATSTGTNTWNHKHHNGFGNYSSVYSLK
jgi:hypothetical protein